MAEPLDLNYSPELFIQMMEFLRSKLENFAPLTSHYGGYTYVFKTTSDKANFDRLIETDEEMAMSFIYDKWKEGTDKFMVVELSSGYRNTVLMGQKGVEISFNFHVNDGNAQVHEPVTVNYTFECNGIRQTVQEQYAANEEVHYNIDNYLLEGINRVTIQVRGNNSKVATSIDVTYTLSELSVSSNFNISREYGQGDNMSFNAIAKGVSDIGDIFVESYIDGSLSTETKVSQDEIGNEKRISIDSSLLPEIAGLHTLQLRTRAVIGGRTQYSRVWYYEWVKTGYIGQIVTIKRELPDENILQSPLSLTIQCEQYVPELITYGFRSSNSDKCDVLWTLTPISGGESTNVGSSDISSGLAGNEGREYTISFLPIDTGAFKLRAFVNNEESRSYDTQVGANTSGLEEASTSDLSCRLFALGRSNNEPKDERGIWKYKNVSVRFNGVQWNGVSGWVRNALQLSEGASAEIDIQPFVDMASASNGVTVEIDFETFNVIDGTDAAVASIGNTIKIGSNYSTLSAPVSHVEITDKFPSNTRLTLAFVVHAKNSRTQPMMMEIINKGVTSRAIGYQSSDNFQSADTIHLGGSDECGIRIYAVRVYEVALSNKQELNNVIVSSEDIATMVRNNDIYDGNIVDVEKIRNRIPCLWVTGRGGTDVLGTIWNSQAKQQIYVNAEWTNPLDGGRTNWRCTDMRLRSHGQSTLRNPMKSLKMWLKTESGQNVHVTEFYNGDSDTPMEDPRWSMKQGSMPQSKFVAQCYYIDSSNCKSPALMNVIDESMRASGIFTEPMRYAIEQYPRDMRRIHGEDPSGRGWKFPYDIRYTPDSIPCVLIARDSDDQPWHYEGIFVLMDDKKSDYLYGERSIYSCPNDPYCFEHNKDDYETLWDNGNVTRFEYLSNTHPISIDNGVSTFFLPPQQFTPDDDEQDVTTTPGGGDTSGAVDSDATYDFEQALELIYPDLDDLRGKKKWPTNYVDTSNLSNDAPHANRLYIFKKWIDDCRKSEQGGDNYAMFRSEAEDHLDLDQWAAYYCFAMPNGTFDNIVRNLQLTTYHKNTKGYHVWIPLWWDIDIQDGTINTGQLAFDPPVDRQTETVRYGIAFRGQESWLWNALEKWPEFIARCRNTMNKLNSNGYTFDKIISQQDSYCNTWPEAMYNESQMVKYKQMYLSNPASNARYLYYLLGDGRIFRRWWLKKNWDYWMARLAAGDAAKNGVAVRWNGGSAMVSVTYGASTFFLWSINDAIVLLPNGAYSQSVNRGDTVSFIPTDTSNSIYSTVYSSAYIVSADYSKNAENLLNANLTNFADQVTGTMLEELNIGVSDDMLKDGKRNGAAGIFEGWGSLTKLKKLNIQGYTAGETIDLSASSQLTHLYAKGSSFTVITVADSLTFEKAELPTTLTIMDMRNVSFKSLKFFKPTAPFGAYYHYPLNLVNASFVGMGEDENVRRLINDWLTANEDNISRLSLNISNLNWDNCSFEEIVRLGKVFRSKRNYQGKVKITNVGVEERNLTNEEMTLLTDLFNDPDKNINVFSVNSSFQIDCLAGVVITGPSEILAGNRRQIVGAVFPLTAGGWLFNYTINRVKEGDDDWFRPNNIGTQGGWQTYKNVRINTSSGIIETTETSDKTTSFEIMCVAYSVEQTMPPEMFYTTVVKRTYPEEIVIDAEDNISATGQYLIPIKYIPEDINGTNTNFGWVFADSEYIKLQDKYKGQAILNVTYFSDDIELTIGYWEEYLGCPRVTAETKTISLIYNANEAILFDASNHEVFFAFLQFIQQSDGEYTIASPVQMTRLEARQFTFTPTQLKDNKEITHFEEIVNFKNLETIDLSGCSHLNGSIEITDLKKCEFVNLEGTFASIAF